MMEKVPIPVLQEDYDWPRWDTFKDLINQDMTRLNKAAIGARSQLEKANFEAWAGDGKFIPLSSSYGTPVKTYIYHHSFHAQCSSVGLQQFREAGIKIITENITIRKCCTHPKKDHDLLQPFFCDDYGLKMLYEQRCEESANEQIEYDLYRSRLNNINTKLHKTSGYFFEEDDWTVRFVDGLTRFFVASELQDKYTADNTTKEGLHFESFQSKFSTLPKLASAYIFHGSPDVIIHHQHESEFAAAVSLPLDEMAGNKGVAKDHTGLPEKLGELIASMYWLIVAWIIKHNNTQQVVCKGLFVDKLLGCGILCKMEARICDVGDPAEAEFVLHASQPYCGRLNPSILCHLLTKLLE